MFRYGIPVFFMATILMSAVRADAQWFSKFWDDVCRDYQRNQAWPEPFLKADREAVNAPFGMMIANGWRRQNLISDYHFDEHQNKLNQAGELKVHFILTQMPPARRTIFVQRGMSPDVTAIRMSVVHRTASKMTGGEMANIVESDLPNDGWPADEIDAVSRSYQTTRPDPRLPSASDSGGNGQ